MRPLDYGLLAQINSPLNSRECTAELCDSGRSGTTIIGPENAVLLAVKRLWFAMLLKTLTGASI